MYLGSIYLAALVIDINLCCSNMNLTKFLI
jgi:hypothetical protein